MGTFHFLGSDRLFFIALHTSILLDIKSTLSKQSQKIDTLVKEMAMEVVYRKRKWAHCTATQNKEDALG